MYSRFQTLVSGLQILKKSFIASNHVSKILRSLPARWRPKVTAIEEAKDLSTLIVEDLISSLKVHEISLDEHDSSKKTKSIARPSKGKSSEALKVIESEDEIGGNQAGKIIGTGTIGNCSISINNVWLVDGLKHNLLSIS